MFDRIETKEANRNAPRKDSHTVRKGLCYGQSTLQYVKYYVQYAGRVRLIIKKKYSTVHLMFGWAFVVLVRACARGVQVCNLPLQVMQCACSVHDCWHDLGACTVLYCTRVCMQYCMQYSAVNLRTGVEDRC